MRQLAAQLQAMWSQPAFGMTAQAPGGNLADLWSRGAASAPSSSGLGAPGPFSELHQFAQRAGAPQAPPAGRAYGVGGFGAASGVRPDQASWSQARSTPTWGAGQQSSSSMPPAAPSWGPVGGAPAPGIPQTWAPQMPNGTDPMMMAALIQSMYQLQRLAKKQDDDGELATGGKAYRRLHRMKRKIATALLRQLLRGLHQTTLEGGEWTTACMMLPGHDPCARDPYGMAEDDLHVIAGYREAQRRIERRRDWKENESDQPERERRPWVEKREKADKGREKGAKGGHGGGDKAAEK